MNTVYYCLSFAAVLVSLIGCASLGQSSPLLSLEQAAVFQPAVYPTGNWDPENLDYKDVVLTASDGSKLHGWFVSHDEPVGVALFCHGNGGNITLLANALRTLNQRHRLAVMTFDYRGYGRSEGVPSADGIMQDARVARRWLAKHAGVEESEIIMMGESLGGAVAVELAARDGARALVLSSTFTSLPDVGAHHAPWLLPRWNMTMRLNSLRKIAQYDGPLLISHGDADEVVPFTHGEKLYEAAAGAKTFFRAPGGRHNDPLPEAYHVTLDGFLRQLPARKRSS